jgi:hypothetical protein
MPPFVGNPPGYIFLNAIEIWPNLVQMTQEMLNQLASELARILRAYYEILNPSRVVSVDQTTPYLYAYHPLTPTDLTAFDNIALDIGAYDFIDGNLELKKRGLLNPYYGGVVIK